MPKPFHFARPSPKGGPPLSRGPGLLILLLLILALCASRASQAGSEWHAVSLPRTPEAPPVLQAPDPIAQIDEPAHIEVAGKIGRGEVFSEALKRRSIEHDAVFELVTALRRGINRAEFNPNIVQRGDRFTLWLDTSGVIQSFEFIKRGALSTRFTATRDQGKLVARKERVPLEREVVVVSEAIEETMWNALRRAGENSDVLSGRLTEIFEYDIDFMVDCRAADTFSLAIEKYYKDGEFVRYGDILAAEYTSARERFQAYLFETGDGLGGYYDADGRSLRGLFLKSPLNYRRISSGYTSRRFHPVLKKYLPHHGVDYAADYGTPVWATADGVVTFTGRKGALGVYVEVRHKNGYKTGYGHLSRIRKGLRKGAYVKQKQIVGYVGATGRATGPHLHYNFYTKSGPSYRLTNPSRATNRPTGKPIPTPMKNLFDIHRDRFNTLLSRTSGSVVTALLAEADASPTLDPPTE